MALKQTSERDRKNINLGEKNEKEGKIAKNNDEIQGGRGLSYGLKIDTCIQYS